MSNTLEPGKRILVGTSFGPDTIPYLKIVSQFCQKTSTKPVWVHANEPLANYYPSHMYGTGLGPELIQQIETENLEAARSRFKELTHQIPDPAPEFRVSRGTAAEVLQSEAEKVAAPIIACSTGGHTYQFIPKGLSTALSLAGSSDSPTLVVPRGCKTSFQSENLRIILADDLGENSLNAVDFVRGMLRSYTGTQLHHIHIDNKVVGGPTSLLDRILEHKEVNGNGRQSYEDKARSYIGSQLMERINPNGDSGRNTPEYFYKQHVHFGEIPEGLNSLCEKIQPDLLVLGRHKTLHTKPLSLGKLPYYSMFSVGVPVLIVG